MMNIRLRSTAFPSLAFCCAALCLLLAAGCARDKSGALRTDPNPPRPEDEQFAEGAGRPATVKTQFAYARILSSRRQDSACDALLSKLIVENPRFMPAYLLQAEVRMRMRRVDAAIETLRSALTVSPRDDILLNDLGVCYLMKPDCSSAFQCFVGAAALRPSNARYRANMALALGLMGREDESASLYKMVVSGDAAHSNLNLLNTARGGYFGFSDPPQPSNVPIDQSAVEVGKPN